MLMIRDFSNRFLQISGMPLSDNAAKVKLRQAGINTNSKQYKAAISAMTSAAKGGVGYTSIACIKNRMRQFDKDGDRINSSTGLAGLAVTDKNCASKNKIIAIPESSRDEMFELTKKEFLRESGVSNGDTTRRSEVYYNLYRKIEKDDRLAAGHTLEQYERQYRQAFVDAVKKVDSTWEIGKPIPSGALGGITRESIDASLEKSGSSLVRRAFDARV